MADDCITFESSVEFTLQFASKNWDGTLSYSSDGTNWVEWTSVDVVATSDAVSGKQKLFLRGSGNTVINSQLKYTSVNNDLLSCTGNIMTLLNYQNPGAAVMGEHCFEQLFKDCKQLISAPTLPAETLSAYCYKNMFYDCRCLLSAPELPACILAPHCYEGMFYNCCTSMSVPPELPATQLAPACYKQMFYFCSTLTSLPSLPATTLAESCYEQMFYYCSKVTQAQPILPSVILTSSCYKGMYQGCSKLESAPQLPATTLAASCYKEMFKGCSKISVAPSLPAQILASYCYANMFDGCNALIQAPQLPALIMEQNCYASMFSSCTALTQAPELPATQLANSCYKQMFYNCSTLVQAPDLPATELVQECYQMMFNGCSSLSSISVNFSQWNNATSVSWVKSVASEGVFFAPVELHDERGDNRIPQNWKFGAKVADDIAVRQTLQEGQTEIRQTLTNWKAKDAPMNLCILRTLYCDGDYNTICLPFSLTADQLATSPLAGFSALRRFVSSTVEGTGADQNLILTIEDVTEIEAGVPYLIAFPEGDNIVNPFFEGVTITCDEAISVGEGVVTFNGTLIPTQLPSTDDYLFIGAHNKLYWPKPDDSHMRGFRAYLKVNTSASSPARKGMPASFQMGKGIVTNQIEHQSDVTTLRKLVKEGRVVIVDGAKKYNLQGQSIE